MGQRFATVPTTYMLEDLNDVQVAGLFYEPEMVLVRKKERMQNIMWKKYWHTEQGKDKNKVLHQMERISKFIQLMGTSKQFSIK